jgi:hypothetical protein
MIVPIRASVGSESDDGLPNEVKKVVSDEKSVTIARHAIVTSVQSEIIKAYQRCRFKCDRRGCTDIGIRAFGLT